MPRSIPEMLAEAAALNAKYGPVPEEPQSADAAILAEQIYTALDAFMECVRYLNTRRSNANLSLTSEAAVQDAIYLMLRPWVLDLVPESPSERVANRFSIKDFVSADARCVIEAKFVRDRDHGKHISREIHDDIETYRHHPRCDTLIFFIYDPNGFVPDREALRRQVESARIYDGRALRCRLVLKP